MPERGREKLRVVVFLSLRATHPDFVRRDRWNEQFLKTLPGPPMAAPPQELVDWVIG